MKTFAINLRFITGTIERFVVTLVSLRKHVVSIFLAVSKAAKRERKKKINVHFLWLSIFFIMQWLFVH